MYDRHRIRRWRIGYEQRPRPAHPGRRLSATTALATCPRARSSRSWGTWTSTTLWRWPGGRYGAGPRPNRRHRSLAGRAARAGRSGPVPFAATSRRPKWPSAGEGCPRSIRRAVPLDLAAGVLGAGRGSWLYRALRETGLATSVSAHHYSPTELGVFSIGADCDAERVGSGDWSAVAEATARLALTGPEAGRSGAGAHAAAGALVAADGGDGRPRRVARGCRGAGRLPAPGHGVRTAGGATSDDQVRGAARRCLDPEAVAAVAYLPRDAGRSSPPPIWRGPSRSLGWIARTERSVATPTQRRRGRGRLGVPRRPLEVRGGSAPSRTPGFDLLVRRKSRACRSSRSASTCRGWTSIPDGKAGVSALAVRSAIRGAGDLDAAAAGLRL